MRLKIKPKFNLCDTVFYFVNNRIRSSDINEIAITASYLERTKSGKPGIVYEYKYYLSLEQSIYSSSFHERDLFNTKEEALDFIKKESEKNETAD